MQNVSVQFVRMDNALIRRRSPGLTRMDDVGLFALLSSFLSIPGFRTPGGGLHRLIAGHCSNGRHSITAAWKRLSDSGYLKRIRMPDTSFHLHDVYTLRGLPDTASPAVSYASLSVGRQIIRQHREFIPPTENYTAVSYCMLMDSRLSLAAKGLYALIRQKLLLAERVREISVNRESLRRSSGMGECAFRRIWKELRDTGYLTLTHHYDANKKQMLYLYSLAEQPPVQDSTPEFSAPEDITSPARNTNLRNTYNADSVISPTLSSDRPASATDQPIAAELASHLEESVKEQIEYEVLRARGNPPALLDLAVEIITQVSLYPPGKVLTIHSAAYPAATVRRALLSLDANEVEYAISVTAAAAKDKPILHMRAYLLSCLFSAKTDYALSLTIF